MIKLESFTEDDIPLLLSWLEDTTAEFLVQFAGRKYKYPLDKIQLLESLNDKSSILLKLIDKTNMLTVGHCQILNLDYKYRTASLGRVLINHKSRGKNYGTLMMQLVKTYAKDNLHLKKISLRVFDFNKPALHCYIRSGFKEKSREMMYFQSIQKEWCCITMEYIF